MKALLKGTGILIIGLAAGGCAERSITAPRAKDASSVVASFDYLPGAQVMVNFEPPVYVPGSIHGQDGWSSLGANGSGCALYDHRVVLNALGLGSYDYPTFGLQSLRLSNAVTSGCFSDQTFSKPLPEPAGEQVTPGTPNNHFEAQWDFASTVPTAEQPDLSVVASPDPGDGSRMSWVQMTDTPNGLEINFFDVRGRADPANFVGPLKVASGLDRQVAHTIRITMDFFGGPSNDVVKVYVDGLLKHTGTSWENYYRYDSEAAAHGGNPPPVDRIMFRTGGPEAPLTLHNGFLIDNFSMRSASGPTDANQCKNDGWRDFDWFNNQGDCIQSVNRGQ
jgi:hypothetical protein